MVLQLIRVAIITRSVMATSPPVNPPIVITRNWSPFGGDGDGVGAVGVGDHQEDSVSWLGAGFSCSCRQARRCVCRWGTSSDHELAVGLLDAGLDWGRERNPSPLTPLPCRRERGGANKNPATFRAGFHLIVKIGQDRNPIPQVRASAGGPSGVAAGRLGR